MQNEKLTKLLIDIGLNTNEASVYLTTLSLGQTTVLKISKNSGLKRSTVYDVVDSLKHKGLMQIVPAGLKQLYKAESPERLETVLENRKLEFSARLPELMAMYSLEGGESNIKFYTGLKSMKQIYLDTLKEIKYGDEYLIITDQEKWFNLDREFWMKEYIQERAKLPCKTRLISTNSELALEHKKFEKNYNEEFKIFAIDTKINVDVVITSNKLIVVDLIPPLTTLVIENKNIIQLQKQMFEIIWKSIV